MMMTTTTILIDINGRRPPVALLRGKPWVKLGGVRPTLVNFLLVMTEEVIVLHHESLMHLIIYTSKLLIFQWENLKAHLPI
jgi:hypothetical protein